VTLRIINVAARVVRVEVEHVKEVAESRHVMGNVRVVFVELRIGKIVAAATGKGRKTPIALDKLHKGGMVAVRVLDMAASGTAR